MKHKSSNCSPIESRDNRLSLNNSRKKISVEIQVLLRRVEFLECDKNEVDFYVLDFGSGFFGCFWGSAHLQEV
jgi:hypothetical protein